MVGRYQNWKIATKITFVVIAVISLVLCAYLAFSSYQSYQRFREALVNRGQRLATLSAKSLANPVWDFDTAQIEEIVQALIANPDIAAATIVDQEGKVIFHDTAAGEEREVIRTQADVIFELGAEHQKVGTLQLLLSTATISSAFHEQLAALIWTYLLLVVLLTGLIQLTVRTLLRPLSELSDAMHRFADGDSGVEIAQIHAHDEVGQVAQAFTQMRNDLDDLKKGLEEKVELRTRELASAKEGAERANVAKSQFLAMMSHEIRTPINGVLGMTDIVLGTKLEEHQRECLEIVRKSGELLLNVINDVLDYSKIEASGYQVQRMPFNLSQHLEETLLILLPKIEEKKIKLTSVIADEVPCFVRADPTAIRQILVNLVGNATKFTPTGGTIDVNVYVSAVSDGKKHLSFNIQDSGIGIPFERQSAIFELFTQADSSTSRHYEGTGLGLSICDRMIKAMGGSFMVSSEPGRGSTFHFDFPVECCDESEIQMQEPTTLTAAAERIRPLRILLTEDNLVNQKVATRMLEKDGHVVELARNGLEALAKLGAEEFDVVLMDIHMPEMDGITATRKIREREQESGNRVPIVALTADVLVSEREKCLAAGMDAYVSKPINRQFLLAALADVVGKNK